MNDGENELPDSAFLTRIMSAMLVAAVVALGVLSTETDDATGEPEFEAFRGNPPDAAPRDAPEDSTADAESGVLSAEGVSIISFRSSQPDSVMRAVLGGPGIYPAFEATVVGGMVPVPDVYEGDELPLLEVYASTSDGTQSFWQTVDPKHEYPYTLTPSQSLEFTVVDEDEDPILGATLRVARDVVGFVNLSGTTSSDGTARVGSIPDGAYRVEVDAPGFVRYAAFHAPGKHRVKLSRGAALKGQVSAAGVGVRDAFVVVWLRDEDGPRPIDVVATSEGGEFRLSGLEAVDARIVVYDEGFAPAASSWRRLQHGRSAHFDVSLEPGLDLEVRVRDGANPVDGALVSWTHASTGESGHAVANEEGIATHSGVPPGAELVARHASSRSNVVRVTEGVSSVELDFEERGRGVAIRVDSWGPQITELKAEMSDGSSCQTMPEQESTWRVTCGGSGRAVVETVEHGTWSFESDFKEDQRVTLPQLETYDLRVTGQLKRSEWARVDVQLRVANSWRSVPWSEAEVGQARARIQLLPHEYKVQVSGAGLSPVSAIWRPGAPLSMELKPSSELRLLVLDARRAPLTGAYVRVWAGGTPRGRFRTSSGQLPVALVDIEDGSTVLVVDPRRGEASVRAQSGREELLVSSPVWSASVAGRPGLSRVEDWLGESLERDGEGLRIDAVDRNSPATRAGIKRGAWLVDAYVDGRGRKTVVYWIDGSYTVTDLDV